MSFRSSLAILAGKSSRWFLHNFMHGGTSLPGELTLKIDPNVLQTLAKDYEIIVITEDGIAERGTHETLLAKNGIYARYYNL